MQKIKVSTLFDCTKTGVRTYRIHSHDQEVVFKRNQQRNWETLIQCLSLRCQPLNIVGPFTFSEGENELFWQFTFETDRDDIFSNDVDQLGLLKEDCNGVPMIIGLTETRKELFLTPYLITAGDHPNTIFELIETK